MIYELTRIRFMISSGECFVNTGKYEGRKKLSRKSSSV